MNRVVLEVMNKIINNGFEVYLVGGFVRDYLLGIESTDYDLATSARPVDLIKIFPDAKATDYGSIFLKYKNAKFEITTFRVESNYKLNRFPKIAYTDSIENDIKRRDFTINSLYMDVNLNIIDLLDGINDINNKTLKMVGNPDIKLKEDALRILRSIRFATLYDLKIDDNLDKSIYECAYLVANLSFQRKKEELDKIFASNNIIYGIKLIKKYHLDKYLDIKIPEHINKTDNYLGIWAQIEYSSSYVFLKNEKYIIKKIKDNLEKDVLKPEVLYSIGLYVASIIGKIDNIDSKLINQKYNNLPIKKRADIVLNASDICNILNINPGKIINEILSDLEKNILNEKILNTKIDLINYLEKKYK